MNYILDTFIIVDKISLNRGHIKNHILRCWKSMKDRHDLPEFPTEQDKFSRKVSFLEALTESLAQFTMSNIILRIYGVSDALFTKVIQYFTLSTSILSLSLAFILVRFLFHCIMYIYLLNLNIIYRDNYI